MKIFTVDSEYDDRRFPVTSKIKRRFKETDEGVSRMCEIIEKYKAEGREEGRYEVITDMLRDGMNINTVARIAKMTAEQVMAIGKKAAVL